MSWYADSKKIDTRGEVYSGLESRKNVASSIRTNFASHLVKYFANPLRENIASSLMARLKKLGGSGPSTHAIWLPHHTFFIFINTIFSLFAEFQISKSIYRKICCAKEAYVNTWGVGWSLEGEGHIDIFRATGRVRVEMSGYWGGSH